ncbi:MAG: hypothetical protein MJE77_25080 [Proteobacteria bacterium]|nr:hypothetical protein [Pseudomonadota bacterium]
MFLGVWEPATGQPAAGGGPVRIVPGNANFLNSLSATVTSQGILLAWVRIAPEHGGSTQLLVETTLLDDTFRVLRDIETVYRRDGLRELVAYGQTALAFEPENETVLLLFPDRDEQEISRRYGILLGPDGLPKPGAEPFRTGFDFGEEVATSAVALPGKGFFITLEKEDSTGTSISGMAIDNDGTPAFLNPVCGAKSFQINTVNQGFQQRPSIARLTNAALQVVWSDRSESFGDPSGSAVRGRLLGSHNLFPVESQ